MLTIASSPRTHKHHHSLSLFELLRTSESIVQQRFPGRIRLVRLCPFAATAHRHCKSTSHNRRRTIAIAQTQARAHALRPSHMKAHADLEVRPDSPGARHPRLRRNAAISLVALDDSVPLSRSAMVRPSWSLTLRASGGTAGTGRRPKKNGTR
jgi:hypothetical protein